MSRFAPTDKFDVVSRMHWTFRGKSGYEAILQELQEWQSRAQFGITSMKLRQEMDEKSDREIYQKLFEMGGVDVRRADELDDIKHNRVSLLSRTSNNPQL